MGKILKSVKTSDADLEKINRYTRRTFSAEEVYTFSLVLCDNDTDRDNERFTVEALFALEKLFLGKTGIFDHNPKAENQSARIYDCKVESVSGRKTSGGDEYFRLTAKAYIPVGENTEDLILAIDSGILKEVSVGCAVSEKICSVCGAEQGQCSHIKGREYGNEKCCYLLNNPTDAYEWSFVAVPAQKQAGVIKGFKNNRESAMKNKTEEILKTVNTDFQKASDMIKECDSITFEREQCRELCHILSKLEKEAVWGRKYKEDLSREFLKLSSVVQPEVSGNTINSLVNKLSIDELREFISAYEKKAREFMPLKPQLFAEEKSGADSGNKAFEI